MSENTASIGSGNGDGVTQTGKGDDLFDTETTETTKSSEAKVPPLRIVISTTSSNGSANSVSTNSLSTSNLSVDNTKSNNLDDNLQSNSKSLTYVVSSSSSSTPSLADNDASKIEHNYSVTDIHNAKSSSASGSNQTSTTTNNNNNNNSSSTSISSSGRVTRSSQRAAQLQQTKGIENSGNANSEQDCDQDKKVNSSSSLKNDSLSNDGVSDNQIQSNSKEKESVKDGIRKRKHRHKQGPSNQYSHSPKNPSANTSLPSNSDRLDQLDQDDDNDPTLSPSSGGSDKTSKNNNNNSSSPGYNSGSLKESHSSSSREKESVKDGIRKRKHRHKQGSNLYTHSPKNSTSNGSVPAPSEQLNEEDDNDSTSSPTSASSDKMSKNINSPGFNSGNSVSSKEFQVPSYNCYHMYLNIRKQIDKKRRQLSPIQPKPPQGFKDYLLNKGSYILEGRLPSTSTGSRPMSSMSMPILRSPPINLEPTSPLYTLFLDQEQVRQNLRIQHMVEKDKLRLSAEQEVLRVHTRAALALANQSLPLSVCTILKDEEIYNVIESDTESSNVDSFLVNAPPVSGK